MTQQWNAEALRESLLWTASSLAALGKEQDVIVLEGRRRTVAEILDEANDALEVDTPPASAQDDAKDWRGPVMEIITGVWDREIQIDHATDEIIDLLSSDAPAAGDARALLDHPLLRDVLGYIEDAGPADVWGAAQSWMALRDAASQQQEG
ncbi:MAG: hypothetical protein QHC88_28120 [Achromobacter sp.]|uniref:hypothetical protein n=1 Tax=Achromobacter sp. TaxID=134375 RepID=UPI0029A6BA6C|nr:hypothetical protein [Achromobacter sp.]MDX3989131.1 hypothetical protein [Achromobacter sp.]